MAPFSLGREEPGENPIGKHTEELHFLANTDNVASLAWFLERCASSWFAHGRGPRTE
jgi:hypothetical protein